VNAPHQKTAVDPVIQNTAKRCARRCVAIIEPLLRQEEIGEAMREFYLAIKEELEVPSQAGNGETLVS
jgi:hypothetical protein